MIFTLQGEHTLNGKIYPLELQLTHKNQHGDIAIVAVMFDIGEPNQAIQNLWGSFPTMEGNSMPIFRPSISTSFYPTIRPTGSTVAR